MLHNYVNPNLQVFSFLDFLKPLGFPFHHISNVADVNAAADFLIFIIVIPFILTMGIIGYKERKKRKQKQDSK